MKDPIDILADKLSNYSAFNQGRSKAVAEYRLAIGINMLSVILLTAGIAAIYDTYTEAVISMIAFFILRRFSGGYHLKSLTACVVVTVGLFVGASFVSLSDIATLTLNTIALVLVAWRAPANMGNTGIPSMFFPYLKVFSVIIVLGNYALVNDQITVVFVCQALLLFPRGR